MSLLSHNILLDQDAFNRASQDLAQLSRDLSTLHGKIDTMLNTLQDGFDTPAGRQFSRSCRENLMRPMNDQRLVIDQISNVLESSRQQYESVFTAYQDLNNSIRL